MGATPATQLFLTIQPRLFSVHQQSLQCREKLRRAERETREVEARLLTLRDDNWKVQERIQALTAGTRCDSESDGGEKIEKHAASAARLDDLSEIMAKQNELKDLVGQIEEEQRQRRSEVAEVEITVQRLVRAVMGMSSR